jgi:hypothetical protein
MAMTIAAVFILAIDEIVGAVEYGEFGARWCLNSGSNLEVKVE